MTTLADNNYREQPELKCCKYCKHVIWYASDYIMCGHEDGHGMVSATAICDRYEPRP